MFCVWYSVLVLLIQPGDVKAATRWPAGSYGLLKPTTGCPKGWKDNGYIFQDTVRENARNNRSDILHLAGHVGINSVLRYFCMKTANTEEDTTEWPKGRYCIYGFPKWYNGIMQPGYIRVYNENEDANRFTSSLATISYGRWNTYDYTKLCFSCQTSGNTKDPIELPITKPFYLLPYGSRECQQVKWMVATSEWINYHTRNYYRRCHQKFGKVPYHILGSDTSNKGITMYYCYYKSCNYTLTKKNGVFQSPRFPRKYPHGQLCSWRIMVPVNHTIHVHFTNFSLYGNDANDTLKYLIRTNGKYRLNQAFVGDRLPFTLTAKSNLKFQFHSNVADTSTGFRAEYNMFIPREPMATTNTPTTMTTDKSNYKDTLMESRVSDGTRLIVVIVIPIVCFIIIVILVVIIYQCRIKRAKDSFGNLKQRRKDGTVMNPAYERGPILLEQPLETTAITTTADTTMNASDDTQMYQPLSRDATDHEDIDYEKLVKPTRNMKPEYSECKEFEPVDIHVPEVMYHVLEGPGPDNGPEVVYHVLEGPGPDNGPEVVYHVLEGPGPNNGPPEDQLYQDVDEEDKCTFNPLYESAEKSAPLDEINKP